MQKMQIVDVIKEEECCCSCKHNIRKLEKNFIVCHCAIDSHYIGYVANFESVCEKWESNYLDEKDSSIDFDCGDVDRV